MSPELEQKLFDDFPLLFDNRYKSPMESPMVFGIECSDGWYDLIRTVCWDIKTHEENIARQTVWKLKDNPEYKCEYYPVRFDQVKEKYGGLRLYYTGGDDFVTGLTHFAESMSYKICEVCGNKGEPNKGGWISVRCEAHRNS
jgi:hypothetical protein